MSPSDAPTKLRPGENPGSLGVTVAPHLSIVTSLYMAEATVREFVERAAGAAATITPDFEIILVNDGSPDNVKSTVLSLIELYPQVKLVDLSRNFGQLPAIHAGLTEARGEYVFVLDADLEEAPELVTKFYARIREQSDVDVVYGIQAARADDFWRATTSRLFYWFFGLMTGIPDLQNMLILRIVTRRFLDAYLTLGDYHLFVAGLTHQAGFRRERLVVEKQFKGHSSYRFTKRLVMAGDAILSFTTQPLYLMFWCSLVAALGFTAVSVAMGIWWLFFNKFAAGWLSLVLSVWLVGALMINCLAIIGLYLAKVFEQTKSRPRYIVRAVHVRGEGR